MIKVLIFDLGNVVVYFDRERAYEQISRLCALPVAKIRQFLTDSGLESEYEYGNITTIDLLTKFQKQMQKSVDLEKLVMAASDIFTPNESLDTVVIKAKRAGLKLALLSNTNEMHFSFIEANFSIIRAFDFKALSYEIRARKPEKEAYERAIEKIGFKKEECLFIDDLQENIVAAQKFGIDGIQYTDTRTLIFELEKKGLKF